MHIEKCDRPSKECSHLIDRWINNGACQLRRTQTADASEVCQLGFNRTKIVVSGSTNGILGRITWDPCSHSYTTSHKPALDVFLSSTMEQNHDVSTSSIPRLSQKHAVILLGDFQFHDDEGLFVAARLRTSVFLPVCVLETY